MSRPVLLVAVVCVVALAAGGAAGCGKKRKKTDRGRGADAVAKVKERKSQSPQDKAAKGAEAGGEDVAARRTGTKTAKDKSASTATSPRTGKPAGQDSSKSAKGTQETADPSTTQPGAVEGDPGAEVAEGEEEDDIITQAEGEPMLSDVVQLTFGFARAGEAYFSPDMRWIIFQAAPDEEEHYQMYVAPLVWAGERITELGDPVRISPPNSRNTCGYFSPDGTSLIFASTAGKEKPDDPAAGYQREGRDYRWSFPEGMEIFRADDWLPAVTQSAGVVDLAKTPITDNNAYDAEGSYSPDGQWLVFCSMRTGDAELYAMAADGSGHAVRLTEADGYDGGPFFSPDGKSIVYRSDRAGNDLLQVFVADLTFGANGSITGVTNERQLTDDANVNWGPYFHPDGDKIIYATSRHGHHNYEIYMMNLDGSQKTRVTSRPGFDGLPVFSPDGNWLMWSSKRTEDDTTQVFVARFSMDGAGSTGGEAAEAGSPEGRPAEAGKAAQ